MVGGHWNILIGKDCATAADLNGSVIIGIDAGTSGTGDNNVVIGKAAADVGSWSGDNCIIIGHDADPSGSSVDNEITLGNASITKLRVPGLNSFEINDSGQFSGVSSTASGTAGVRKITASTSSPSGGADGDIWIKYAA